jgi:hypothetical protein
MFLKFIAHDGQQLVIETNSYQVTDRPEQDSSGQVKFVLANVVKSDWGNGGESPTEFRMDKEGWQTMFVMNDRGETVDRVHISLPPDSGK